MRTIDRQIADVAGMQPTIDRLVLALQKALGEAIAVSDQVVAAASVDAPMQNGSPARTSGFSVQSQVGATVTQLFLSADVALANATATLALVGGLVTVVVTGILGQTINWTSYLDVSLYQT